MIFTQLIQTNLRTKELGKKIEYYNRLESTNTEAWELIGEGNQNGTVIITDNQTIGRGRKENSWIMIPGKGLAFSLIIENEYPNNYSGLISLITAIAVVESLNKRGIETKLKWPNDIFVNKKKLGGILCETKIIKKKIVMVVIGVGINVNETISEHPENIREHLTTMFEISNNCLHLNNKISFYENEKIIEGVFTGLDSNGFAKIEINNEIKTYGSINLI